MNEYFECYNCGNIVQGFVASQQVECCQIPSYQRIERAAEYIDNEWDRVIDKFACPNPACGEDRIEWLVIPEWSEVGEDVHCESCGL